MLYIKRKDLKQKINKRKFVNGRNTDPLNCSTMKSEWWKLKTRMLLQWIGNVCCYIQSSILLRDLNHEWSTQKILCIKTSDRALAGPIASITRTKPSVWLDGCMAMSCLVSLSIIPFGGRSGGRPKTFAFAKKSRHTNLSQDSSKSTQLQQQARMWLRSSFRSKYSQQHSGSVSTSSPNDDAE